LEAVGADGFEDAPAVRSVLSTEDFSDLYQAHVRQILGWLQSRTFSAQVAADLCAETFAVALEDRRRFDPTRGDPGAWLWGIARNLLRRYLRTEAVDRRARARLAIIPRVVPDDDLDLIEREIDRPTLEGIVQDALATLSPAVAQAVRLRVLEQRSYAEVALRCECSESAARIRVSRGLSKLLDSAQVSEFGEVTW
jgi:RNA polymerase sigma-70 factor (ECF subfamily)